MCEWLSSCIRKQPCIHVCMGASFVFIFARVCAPLPDCMCNFWVWSWCQFVSSLDLWPGSGRWWPETTWKNAEVTALGPPSSLSLLKLSHFPHAWNSLFFCRIFFSRCTVGSFPVLRLSSYLCPLSSASCNSGLFFVLGLVWFRLTISCLQSFSPSLPSSYLSFNHPVCYSHFSTPLHPSQILCAVLWVL